MKTKKIKPRQMHQVSAVAIAKDNSIKTYEDVIELAQKDKRARTIRNAAHVVKFTNLMVDGVKTPHKLVGGKYVPLTKIVK